MGLDCTSEFIELTPSILCRCPISGGNLSTKPVLQIRHRIGILGGMNQVLRTRTNRSCYVENKVITYFQYASANENKGLYYGGSPPHVVVFLFLLSNLCHCLIHENAHLEQSGLLFFFFVHSEAIKRKTLAYQPCIQCQQGVYRQHYRGQIKTNALWTFQTDWGVCRGDWHSSCSNNSLLIPNVILCSIRIRLTELVC